MAGNKNFSYDANRGAAVLFAVLFGLTLIMHFYQTIRYRTRYMIPLLLATMMQCYGYITRYLAILHENPQWTIISSSIAIVVAPAFLAAQDYMIVGRMMSYVGPKSTFISHRVISKIFVTLDILCILTQVVGSNMLFNDEGNVSSTLQLGRLILIGGMAGQVVSFLLFVLITIFFDRRARQIKGEQLDVLRPLFTVFYLSAFLVIGRSVYRTIEFGTIKFDTPDGSGYILNHEWPFYMFDSLPVFIATAAFNVVHPGAHLPKKKGLRMDGSMEPVRKHWWSRAVKEKPAADSMVSLAEV